MHDWGSKTAHGVAVDHFRLWPKFKWSTAVGYIRLVGLADCNGQRFYRRAVATVTVLSYGASRPHQQVVTESLAPQHCG